jgi:hypothetical protein
MYTYVAKMESNASSHLLLFNKDVLIRVFSIQPQILMCKNALTLSENYVI